MTSCLEASEYEQAISAYALGSLSTIDEPYWVRSFECEPVDSSIDGTRKVDFATWWYSEAYKQERVDFVHRQVIRIAANSSLKEQDARELVLEVVDYILKGMHVGLSNPHRLASFLTSLRGFIGTIPVLDKAFSKWRGTDIGVFLRRKLRREIRGHARKGVPGIKPGVGYHSVDRELENIRVLMTGFHAARSVPGQ
jgi:hypothetical protein